MSNVHVSESVLRSLRKGHFLAYANEWQNLAPAGDGRALITDSTQPLGLRYGAQMAQMTLDSWRIVEDFLPKHLWNSPIFSFANSGTLSVVAGAPAPLSQFPTAEGINHPGVVKFSTGSDSTGWGGVFTDPQVFQLQGGEHYRAVLKTLGNDYLYYIRGGFGDLDIEGVPENGTYLEVLNAFAGGTPVWFGVTINQGTSSVSDVRSSTRAWEMIEIVVSDDASEVSFFINGVLLDTLTTNIPYGRSMGVYFFIANWTAPIGNVTCYLDLIDAWNDNLDGMRYD